MNGLTEQGCCAPPLISSLVGFGWQHTFTLKMATAMFAEMEKLQPSTRNIPQKLKLYSNSILCDTIYATASFINYL
jgi:hypothetical protein